MGKICSFFNELPIFASSQKRLIAGEGEGVTERLKEKKMRDGGTRREGDERTERKRVGETARAWEAMIIDSRVPIWFN
jgi:hypothetical protein